MSHPKRSGPGWRPCVHHEVRTSQAQHGTQRHVDLFHGRLRDGAEQFSEALSVSKADGATSRVATSSSPSRTVSSVAGPCGLNGVTSTTIG